jgi:hypothetical protein
MEQAGEEEYDDMFHCLAFSIKLGQPLLKETNIRYTFEMPYGNHYIFL